MAKNDNYREISELKSIIESRALGNLLIKRKDHLQNKVNINVRAGELMKAYGELSKLDDCNKLIDMMKLRIETLNKEN